MTVKTEKTVAERIAAALKRGIVISDDCSQASGPLKPGIEISGVTYAQYVMRAPVLEDMLSAELEAGVDTPLNFNAQMLCRQLVCLTAPNGDRFEGPFTIGVLKRMRPADWRALRAAQTELDALGEAE